MVESSKNPTSRAFRSRAHWSASARAIGVALLVSSCSAFSPEPVATFELTSFGQASLPVTHTRWVDHRGVRHGELVLGGRLVLQADQRFVRTMTTQPSADGTPTGLPRDTRIAGTYREEGSRLVFFFDAGEREPHSWSFERGEYGVELVGEENHYFDPNAHFVATVSYRKDG